MQEYVESLEQATAATEARETAQIIVRAATEFAQRMQAEQGLTPEQTAVIARREAQQALREFNGMEFRRGQINAAFDIGARHGIDPRALMNLPTPQAMERMAASVKARGAAASEVAKLKAEIEKTRQKKVSQVAGGPVPLGDRQPLPPNLKGNPRAIFDFHYRNAGLDQKE